MLVKCSKDKAPDPNINTSTCDSTSVSYNKHIKTILDNNCATSGCHDATTKRSGYDFSDYLSSKAGITPALCNINDNGCTVMPPSGKMADSLITKIQSWKDGGFCQ